MFYYGLCCWQWLIIVNNGSIGLTMASWLIMIKCGYHLVCHFLLWLTMFDHISLYGCRWFNMVNHVLYRGLKLNLVITLRRWEMVMSPCSIIERLCFIKVFLNCYDPLWTFNVLWWFSWLSYVIHGRILLAKVHYGLLWFNNQI